MHSPYYRAELLFKEIMRKIESVDHKISVFSQQVKAPLPLQTVYLSLPIQKTKDALKTFGGSATAQQVSAITGRARAVESMHLNELWRMGLVDKEKQGRKQLFRVKVNAEG